MISEWPVSSSQLVVGGIPISRLAERVGRTPFYAYDRSKVMRTALDLKSAMPESLRIKYAIKSNPMTAIVHQMKDLIAGFDVASTYEMDLALNTGCAPRNISFSGPGKPYASLLRAAAAGVTITIESLSEAEMLLPIASLLGTRPRVAVRINPPFAIKRSGMQMGGGAQQFGIDSERLSELIREPFLSNLDIVGLHIFAGSQNLDGDVIAQGFGLITECLVNLARSIPYALEYLNVGGGFGIPYFENDRPLDIKFVADRLKNLIIGRIQTVMNDAYVELELGRYLVGEAGIYVSRVVDKKTSRGKTFLILDGGMHHHLAASGNLGQIIRRNYPIVVANRMSEPSTEEVTVTGCLCTPLDILGSDVLLPKTVVGDFIAILQSGAYGYSASPAGFLGHPPAAEVLV